MTNETFQFVVVEQEDDTILFGVQFFDRNTPIGYATFGELSHDLLDFMIQELQEIKTNELIPPNTAVH